MVYRGTRNENGIRRLESERWRFSDDERCGSGTTRGVKVGKEEGRRGEGLIYCCRWKCQGLGGEIRFGSYIEWGTIRCLGKVRVSARDVASMGDRL